MHNDLHSLELFILVTNVHNCHTLWQANNHIFIKEGVFLRQNQMWQTVLVELNRSLYSEGMVCSMSTQLFYIPETAELKGNSEMHTALVPASYHRVTASGSAQRLYNGETESSILQTLINCIENAEKRDMEVRNGLTIMESNAPASYKPFIQTIIMWQDDAEMHLSMAKQLIIQFTGNYSVQT